MNRAIIVDGLVKKFEVIEKEPGLTGAVKTLIAPKKKITTALKGVSFAVQPGELVGFIGPNGAGKTTTLKTLSGLLFPSEGFVQVLELDPWKRSPEFLKQISLVMGQKNQLWWDLPAIETFDLNRVIYDIPTRMYKENLNELVELLDIGKLLKIPVRKLSLGQRMRMELTAALLHKPKVLFLDEPTIGLDIVAQAKVRDFIYEYNSKYGATILLTSHNMDDLTNLARRVIVINNGQILYDGAFEEMISRYAKEKLIKARLSNENNISELEKIGQIKKLSFPEVVLSVPRTAAAVAAAELLQNFPVDDLTIEEVPIDEVVKRVFKSGSLNK